MPIGLDLARSAVTRSTSFAQVVLPVQLCPAPLPAWLYSILRCFPSFIHFPTTVAPAPSTLLQVVLTLAAVAFTGMAVTGGALGGPGAIILGGGLALSTTAVGMQVGPACWTCCPRVVAGWPTGKGLRA